MESTKKKFVIICGCAGAGKTTIGKIVAKKLNYFFIDKDTVSNLFTDFILKYSSKSEGDRESAFYSSKIKPIEYESTFKICFENLELGNNVIAVIPMTSVINDFEEFNKFVNLKSLKNKGIDVKIIWINHNEDLEHKRLMSRNSSRDINKLQNWEIYAKGIKNLKPDKLLKALNYDNDILTDEKIDKLIKWIEK